MASQRCTGEFRIVSIVAVLVCAFVVVLRPVDGAPLTLTRIVRLVASGSASTLANVGDFRRDDQGANGGWIFTIRNGSQTLTWSDTTDETAGSFNVAGNKTTPYTRILIDANGAIVSCASGSVARVTVFTGALGLRNITVRGCTDTDNMSGTSGRFAALFRVSKDGAVELSDASFSDLNGVRVVDASGTVMMRNIRLSRVVIGGDSAMCNVQDDCGGAALLRLVDGGTATVENTSVVDVACGSPCRGCVIVAYGSASVAAARLSTLRTSADLAGVAVFTASAQGVFSESAFMSARGDSGCGAFLVYGSAVVAVKSSVTNDTTADNGGLACVEGDATFSLEGMQISQSRTTRGGGCLAVFGNSAVTVSSTNVTGVSASSGGFLSAVGSAQITATDLAVYDAHVDDFGAVFTVGQSASFTAVRMSTLATNSDTAGVGHAGDNARVDISESSFKSSRAVSAGGAFYFEGNAVVSLLDSVADGTSAGFGGLGCLKDGATLSLAGMQISRCSARGVGGALALVGSAVLVVASTNVTGVTATGGGFIAASDDVQIIATDLSVVDAVASDWGGAFDMDGNASLQLTRGTSFNCSISADTSGSGGFALFSEHANGYFEDCLWLAEDIVYEVPDGLHSTNSLADWTLNAPGGVFRLVETAQVVVANCEARHFHAQFGAFAWVGGLSTLTVSGSRLLNIGSVNGGVFSADSNSTTDISSSVVRDCYAINQGGFIDAATSAIIRISDVDVFGCSAQYGTLFCLNDQTTADVHGLHARDAFAWNIGAVAYLQHTSHMTLSDAIIMNSLAGFDGGVLGVTGKATLNVQSVVVTAARAAKTGGFAIIDNMASVHMRGLVLSNVTAGLSGGAFFVGGNSSLLMEDVNATHTVAVVDGGFMRAENATRVVMSAVKVSNCTAQDGGAFGVYGSAVLAMADVVARSTAANENGGFLFATDSCRVSVSRLSLGVSSAWNGGAFIASGYSSLDVLSSRVDAVSAVDYGGFARVRNHADMRLSSSHVTNASAGYGGAFFVDSLGTVTINDVVAENVRATDNGGFANGQNGLMNVSGLILRDASVSASGGVFYMSRSSRLLVTLSTFEGVRADDEGGFLYARHTSRTTVLRVRIAGTDALSGGAVSVADAAVVDVLSSTVVGAHAIGDGGVAHTGDSATLRFVASSLSVAAAERGGVVCMTGASVVSVESGNATLFASASMGGFAYTEGTANLIVTGVTAQNGKANTGGLVYSAQNSTVGLVRVNVSSISAYASGGCMYADDTSAVIVSGGTYSGCVAGAIRATGGAGGVAFVGFGASFSVMSDMLVLAPSAVLGPAFYSQHMIDPLSQAHIVCPVLPADYNDPQLPGWRAGGLFSGSPSFLNLTVSGTTASLQKISVSSGESFPPLSLSILDGYGNQISTDGKAQLSVRLIVSPLDQTDVANAAAQAPLLRGDVERSYGTGSVVTFNDLRLYAPPGRYKLAAVSSNPFLYGELDLDVKRPSLLRDFMVDVTIEPCPSGQKSSAVVVDGKEMAECVPEARSNTLAIALSSSFVGGAVLIAALGVARWRLAAAMRMKRDLATHAEFMSKHMTKQADLMAMQLKRENVELLEKLGEGEFGVVCRARVVSSDGRPRVCAAKMLKEGATFDQRCDFLQEAAVMQGMAHPHVVSLCAIVVESDPMLILIEFVPHGNLLQFVRSVPAIHRTPASASVRIFEVFCEHIALGMAYLADMHIVHRDLAARNVMVGQDAFGSYLAKIGDFGLSGDMGLKNYFRKTGKEKLPVRWMSPEALSQRKYAEASDVWSFGVTAWEMFSFGEVPYGALAGHNVLGHVRAGGVLSSPPCCEADFYRAIIQPCFAHDPASRPTFDHIANAAFPGVMEARKSNENSRRQSGAVAAGHGHPGENTNASHVTMVVATGDGSTVGFEGYSNVFADHTDQQDAFDGDHDRRVDFGASMIALLPMGHN